MPDLRLRVGSPGYKSLRRARIESVDGKIDGVDWLGALPHERILQEVRTALCVFYPNFVLPETFGLVLAEAKAVGTPVLTHACGAASEVLADPRMLLPVTPSLRVYEQAASRIPSGLRRFVALWAEPLGLFQPYVNRLHAWRYGERPAVGPDARFRLSVVAQRWRALFAGELGADKSLRAAEASDTRDVEAIQLRASPMRVVRAPET
jgi:Glycosyl transferases group 1